MRPEKAKVEFDMTTAIIFQRDPACAILRKNLLYLSNGTLNRYVSGIVFNQPLHVTK
jgi:hypothetical protein